MGADSLSPMAPTRRDEEPLSRTALRCGTHHFLAVVVAVCLLATGCGGSSDTEDASEVSDAAMDEEATEVELFPIPSPDPSPTESAEEAATDDAGEQDAETDDETEPGATAVDEADPDEAEGAADDRPAIWRHVDGFDLLFENGRPDLNAAVATFYEVGDGDIDVSVDNILASIGHSRSWQHAADAAVATFPEGLGEASGVFALLSTQWALIGCEAHWAGMNQGRWNTQLFDHLVAEATGLPAEQADNQAGILLEATNAAIATLCPRLLPA